MSTVCAQELREAGLLATEEQPEPPAVTAQVLSTLKGLDAVCNESLRLMAPVPGSARRLNHDTEARTPSPTAPTCRHAPITPSLPQFST